MLKCRSGQRAGRGDCMGRSVAEQELHPTSQCARSWSSQGPHDWSRLGVHVAYS
jgi:hypothetical protein